MPLRVVLLLTLLLRSRPMICPPRCLVSWRSDWRVNDDPIADEGSRSKTRDFLRNAHVAVIRPHRVLYPRRRPARLSAHHGG